MIDTEGPNDTTQLYDISLDEWNPETTRLLKAVEKCDLEKVQSCINSGAPVNGFGGAFHETALHRAAQQGWTEGVELLLLSGANVYSKNHYDQTPLHYACASKSCLCVHLLIDAGCQPSLHQKDKRGHTPLHDAAADGCKKCVSVLLKAGAQVSERDFNGETPLHKAAKCSSIPTMLVLLNKGADLGAKDKSGESVLSYVLRMIPGGLDVLFDNCLITNTEKLALKKLEVCFNFKPISGSSDKNQVRNLRDIVDLGHPKLLLHPLCEAFLLLKWNNVRVYYFIEVMLFFFYAILANYLILSIFVFERYKDTPLPASDGGLITLQVIISFQTALMFLKEIVVFFQGIRLWLCSVSNPLNCIICVLVLIVMPRDPGIRRHHVATVAILLLWVQCMLHISRFPSCGIYIAMFIQVAKVFLRIFLIFFCLLLAFSMSFYVSHFAYGYSTCLSEDENETESRNNLTQCCTQAKLDCSSDPHKRNLTVDDPIYYNPVNTFFKTVTMMIGELDFDNDFVGHLNHIPVTSHFIYMIFVILVSIILSNLLVALAVNDVQALRNSAYLERLIKQMELVFQHDQSSETFECIASLLKLPSFSEKRKKFRHDLLSARVSIEPHHPLKGKKIFLADNGVLKYVTIKREFITSVMDCLSSRERISIGSKRSVKRGTTRSSRNSPDEMQVALKNVETNLTDLVNERMDEMTAQITARITALEDMITRMCTQPHRPGTPTGNLEFASSPMDGNVVNNQNHLPPTVLSVGPLFNISNTQRNVKPRTNLTIYNTRSDPL